MKKIFLLLLFNVLFAKVATFSLTDFYPSGKFIRGSNGEVDVSIPIPDRLKIKKALIHLEFIPSKALVKSRSVLYVMFNDTVVFQKKIDKDIDLYSYDIVIPLYLIKDFNRVRVKASQHYCIDCCENSVSSELWTQVLWKKSYLKIDYEFKNIKKSLLSYRDYVLDFKNFNPIEIGIFTQSDNNDYLTMGARISGYLGSIIKYRKIYIERVSSFNVDKDIFLLGSREYIKNLFKLKDVPNVFVLPNPFYPNRAIVVLNAENEYKLKDVVDAFISIPKSLLLGENIDLQKYKKPVIGAYESPLYIPFGEKIYLSDLGYSDFKFYNPFYEYRIEFNIPPDVFILSQRKFLFHLFYNYNAAVEKASAINIFVNGKFVTAIEVKNEYGTILEDKKLKIPVYLLKPGKNEITIQYALKAPGKSKCNAANYKLLQGTVFAKKSYIELPYFAHWKEMAYMELFTTSAYPFSIYPDLRNTQIFLASKTKNVISAMYTLMAYIGEKTFVPLFNVNVVSSKGDIDKNSNVIALGFNMPQEFFANMPIKFDANDITLKFDIFKKISNTLQNRMLGKKVDENLETILKLKDRLIDETVFVEGESPYSDGKTFLLLISKNDKDILTSVKKLYNPKFSSKIKGDLVVIDNKESKVYYADVGKKYYVGYLPWFEYFMFKIGFSFPMILLMFVGVAVVLVILLKLLLDLRRR